MKISAKDILFYYFQICIALATAPFFVWHVKVIYVTFLSYFIIAFWGAERSAIYRISLVMISCFYIIAFLHFYGNTNLFGRLLYLIPLFLYFIKGTVWKKVYDVFWKWYSYALIPSLLVYFIVIFAGIDLPSITIEAYNEIKDYDYTVYPFLVVSNEFSDIGIQNFRFSGYFDEAGVVGTMSGVIFTVNKCDLKNWRNWPILLSGIFSFSLFFFLLVFIYVLIWAPRKYKFGLASFLAIVIAYILSLEENLFKDLILSRLTIEDGEWVGNNRTTDSFNSFYDRFTNSSHLWFGYGSKYCATVVDPNGASYKHLIVDHGLIPFFIYVTGMISYYFAVCGFSRRFVFLLFLFFSILFQRQFLIFGLQGVFMLLSPCYVYNSINQQLIDRNSKLRHDVKS